MNENPLVSIIVLNWNGVKWLNKCLTSLKKQSFKNFEIIVQDDASTDDTIEVVKKFNDLRISIFKNEKNLGYSGNLESLSKKGEGEIIYLMGQDDILGESALLDTCRAFEISDDIGAVATLFLV